LSRSGYELKWSLRRPDLVLARFGWAVPLL
jgi:hypothetical protein